MPGKKISDLDVYDDVNTDKSRRDLLEISKNTGTYGSPTYATNGSRKITIEQLKETLFIKDINSYNQVTTGSPTFDKQAYNGIANAGTYTLPTSVGSYEVLAIILEAELNVTVNGLGTGISDLVFTKQNETALLIDTTYGWLPLAVNKEVNSSAFELLANKENTTLDTSSTKYPTNNLVKTYVDNLGNTLTSGLATKLTIANNLSDLTNTTQARDNLLLGATNDVTHNSITLSNTTVSTLPFIDSAKKIISATGALLGTWFQTLTADTNPVDADTIVINDSANSFEAKKTTLLQLWTNYIKAKADALYLTVAGGTLTGALNYAPSVTLTSASTVNIGGANSNNIIISGTTTITAFDTVAEGIVRIIRFTGALTLTHNATSLILPNGSNITTQSNDTAIFRSMGAGNWVCISYKSVTALAINNIPYWDGSKFVNSNFKLSNANSNIGYWDNLSNSAKFGFASYSGNAEVALMSASNTINFYDYSASVQQALMTVSSSLFRLNFLTSLKITQGGSNGRQIYIDSTMNYYANNIHQFTNSSNTNIASINSNGLAIGSSTINASAQLDLQSTTKGFLKNRVTTSQKTSISSPANGLNVYDTDLATDSSYTTRNSINSWIDSKIKFSELFDPFLIDQQVTANGTAYVARFKPKSDMIITAIEFIVTSFTSSETYYVGVYNTDLTSKLTDGSASITSSGEKQISVTPIKLTGATTYYLVIKDNNGGTLSVGASTSYANTLICSSKFIGAGALPSDLTSGGSPTADTKAPYLGVISL